MTGERGSCGARLPGTDTQRAAPAPDDEGRVHTGSTPGRGHSQVPPRHSHARLRYRRHLREGRGPQPPPRGTRNTLFFYVLTSVPIPWWLRRRSVCRTVAGDLGSIPGLGRSPGEGHGNPRQYSCLENPHGRRSLVGYSLWGHNSRTRLSDFTSSSTPILSHVASGTHPSGMRHEAGPETGGCPRLLHVMLGTVSSGHRDRHPHPHRAAGAHTPSVGPRVTLRPG